MFGLPRLAVIGGAVLIGIIAFYLVLNAYGNSRYKAGKADADAAWVAASNKLIAQAQNSADKADKKQAAQAADFAAKQEAEKEKIANAQANGTSPFDVMFGNGS